MNRTSLCFKDKFTPKQMRDWLSEMEFAQDEAEFSKLLEVVRGKTKLLEIGSRFGVTLKRFAQVMPKGSHLVSVDLPGDDLSMLFLNSEIPLKERVQEIRDDGYRVDLILSDSHDPFVVDMVRQMGPFDVIFIDGDHSEEGVRLDWENYSPMSNIVAFHDIAENSQQPCKAIWKEMKQKYRTEEFTDSGWMGIGVVYK